MKSFSGHSHAAGRSKWLVAFVAVLSTFSTDVSAQTTASRIVLGTVIDGRGSRLTTLAEDDFVVHEAGEAREVLSARLADYPIVVLVDNRGPSSTFDAVRRAAARFVARIGRERPVAVGAVAHPSTMLTAFDDERTRVTAAIAELQPRSSDAELLVEGVENAARAIRATEAPFSAIVVISAADLNVAVDDPGVRLTALFNGRTTVHVIVQTTAPAANAVGTLGDTLRVLTDQTRGQFTAIFSVLSYQAALDRLADRLSSEMMIEFIVPPGTMPSDDVKVGVRIPGARVTGLGVSR